MELRTLSHTPLSQITRAFNQAFSDYFIPLQFTDEGMATKIKGEGIQMDFSVGAFEGEELVGFILHAGDDVAGVNTIYNAGTGVLPLFRGRGLTKALYHFAFPLLQKKGFSTHLLEVIDNNHPAKKVYEAIGFRTVRKLAAFRWTRQPAPFTPMHEIKSISHLPTDASFVSMVPAWQNTAAAVNRDREGHALLGAFRDGALVGYAAFVPATGRVKQCAVHPTCRRQKIGTTLFHFMLHNSGTGSLLVTNVDETYQPAIRFLHALGFERILGLHEMKLVVV